MGRLTSSSRALDGSSIIELRDELLETLVVLLLLLACATGRGTFAGIGHAAAYPMGFCERRPLLVLAFNPKRGINVVWLCADSGRAVLVSELEKRKKNAGKTRKRTKKVGKTMVGEKLYDVARTGWTPSSPSPS